MFEGTGPKSLGIYQDPQATLKNQMGPFDEADIQKYYARVQVKDDETIIIESRSHKIGRNLQALVKIAFPQGIDKAPSYNTSII